MKKVKIIPNPTHEIWKKVRGPFRVIHCPAHDWERYDVQSAGCRKCGALHTCKIHLCDNDCPLVRLDDYSTCCTITGFCIPTVRYSDCEYVESVSYVQPKEVGNSSKVLYDEVLSLVRWFLTSKFSIACKTNEVNKSLTRVNATSLKVLKQFKMTQAASRRPMCFLTAFAQTLHQLKLRRFSRASQELCSFCATHITTCLNKLCLANLPNRKANVVFGMLYLMKQGLVIQNTQWLPKTPELANCLPHETNLDKVYKLSMKLVCETENEIKLALRHQVKLI